MRRGTKLFSFILVLLLSSSLFGTELTGEGRGNTKLAAKKEALADLSSQIQISIKSLYSGSTSLENNKVTHKIKSTTTSNSNVELIGVEYSVKKKFFSSTYIAKAQLKEGSLALYEKTLNEYRLELLKGKDKLDAKTDLKEKLNTLNYLIKKMEKFESYKLVANILGSKGLFSLTFTLDSLELQKDNIEKQLKEQALKNKINSLEIATLGAFHSDSKEFFDSEVFNTITLLSNGNKKFVVTIGKDKKTDSSLTVMLNSNITTIKAPIKYNGKVIQPKVFVTNLNATFEIVKKDSGKQLFLSTISGKGLDNNSDRASYEKAVSDLMIKLRSQLGRSLFTLEK